MLSIRILSLVSLALASYSPDNHDDWRLLKPSAEPPLGSYSSLPFKFGIIANPIYSDTTGNVVKSDSISPARLKDVSVAFPDTDTSSVLDVMTDVDVPDKSVNISTDSNVLDAHLVNSRHGQVSFEKRHVDVGQDNASSQKALSILVPVSCTSDTVLQLTLDDGILLLTGDRIGSIVSNHQFQFDGPVPQHGALYAAGWLVTSDGLLCLGNQTVFFQCTSGDFYKLFDDSIGSQCSPVQLDVIELISC